MSKKKKQQPITIKLQIEENLKYQPRELQLLRTSYTHQNKYYTLHSYSSKFNAIPFKERPNKSFKFQSNFKNESVSRISGSTKQIKKPVKKKDQEHQQYCLINQNFVKISKIDEQTITDKFLLNTASSTQGFGQFKQNHQYRRFQTKSLRKKAKYIRINTQQLVNEKVRSELFQFPLIKQNQKVIDSHDIQIQAIPNSYQIGLQYSQRIADGHEKKKKQQKQENNGSTLTNLLKSIQNAKNFNQQQLQAISPMDAQFYSSILQNILNQLRKHKYVQNNAKRSQTQSNLIQKNQNSNVTIQYEDQQLENAQLQLKKLKEIQQMHNLIYLRQYKQISFIDEQYKNYKNEQIRTNLLSVISFLCEIFAYIELNYVPQFLKGIRKIYGLTYKQKFSRITQGISLEFQTQFQVIHSQLFQRFIQESGKHNQYEQIHLKAVFDGLNEHLQQYRPYFIGNGQPFNWSLKMYQNISEYSIDEESIPIIFRQTKQKMVQWCTGLCGIIIQTQHNYGYNILKTKHKQNQDKLIYNWIKNNHFQKDSIDVYSTQILYELGQWIFQEIIEEFLTSVSFKI